MWQALFAEIQSALLGSMKISPSDKGTGNTLPFARPPLCFSCHTLSIICIRVVFKDPRFLCGCPMQGMLLTQCHSRNGKAPLKDMNWHLWKELHFPRGQNQLGSGLIWGSHHPVTLWGINMPSAWQGIYGCYGTVWDRWRTNFSLPGTA